MHVGASRSTAPPQLTAENAPAAPPSASAGLVGEHFAAAVLYLLAGGVGLVWVAPDLAAGMYLAPHVAAVTHLFTLGWLTLTILGALNQLLPMALGAPTYSVRLAHAAFWTLAPGIGVFAYGVAAGATPFLVAGVLLVASGTLLAVGNVAATLARGRTRDVTWAAMVAATAFLGSTLVFGLVLAHNLHSGFIAAARVRVLTAHLHVALVGWVLVMMVGVAHRTLPMFLVAHGAERRWSRRALILLVLGVPAFALGLMGEWPVAQWAGAALLVSGVAAFEWQAHTFYRVRTRPSLDVGMRFARAGLVFLAVAAAMGPVLLARGNTHTRLATAYVVTGLLGGLVPFVTGFLYEIVPTLTWRVRFGGRLNRGRMPRVMDLYSAPLARWQLTLYVGGVAVLLAGIAASAPALARAGALLFLLGVLLFIHQILRMRWGTPTVPGPPPQRP
ncbi:MAG: hypothetical protein ACYCVL_01010 [Gemmatimonadaceae bacterium]